jgi:archaellum component FlaC
LADDNLPQGQSLLENFAISLDKRVGTLEGEVQKLATIVNKIANDQAVIDFKQEQNIRFSSKLEEMVDKARDKVEDSGKQFIREMNAREARLNESLNAYKILVDKTFSDSKTSVDKEIERLENDVEDLADKVSDLQRWIWIATGGGAVALFVFEILLRVMGYN